MQKRPLGSTGIEVSILGYGAMELRGQPRSPALDDAAAARLLGAVLDGGINVIDTSIDYGRSEELIGRSLAHRRDEYVLASKCGCVPGGLPANMQPPYPHDYGRQNIRTGVEQSLRLLQTDRIDLMQIHMSPSRAELEAQGTVEELVALRDEGKIRFIGMSGILPDLDDHLEMKVFDVVQVPYSALQREHEAVINEAAAAGNGVLVRGGAARGAASDDKAWRTGPTGIAEGEGQRRWNAAGLDDLYGSMTPMEFILRFTLSLPALSSTIVGTSSIAHLNSNLEIASRGPLPAEMYEQAKRRLDEAVG